MIRARDNPLSTDRVLRVRYRLPPGVTWDGLLARLAGSDHRAAIVGEHGSGKTTLMEDLAPRIEVLGFTMRPLRLDAEHRRFDPDFMRGFFGKLTRQDFILLDGAEQLSGWAWRRFRRATERAGGLLVTSHRPGLLPTLLECTTSPALLEGILEELLGQEAKAVRGEALRLLQHHRGNVREVLRSLYDLLAGENGAALSSAGSRNPPPPVIQGRQE